MRTIKFVPDPKFKGKLLQVGDVVEFSCGPNMYKGPVVRISDEGKAFISSGPAYVGRVKVPTDYILCNEEAYVGSEPDKWMYRSLPESCLNNFTFAAYPPKAGMVVEIVDNFGGYRLLIRDNSNDRFFIVNNQFVFVDHMYGDNLFHFFRPRPDLKPEFVSK